MRLFCRHKWELLSETKTDSPLERMCDQGLESFDKAPAALALQTHIQVFHCTECGKLKRFMTQV